ncbi:P-loop NTPase [Halomicroarcula sp. S1AR25-4]|uniref:P-loop NTPase n=1 Tax=Haloarcula sp. S1AR25-4 TaxID=2950538 RepID=UPI0028750E5B|nr:P-loop NTPase [Halomicroarcula sp. S1AR25-4]MDS0277434.1 P-loop NTPase [Halomicroarcula sp. S1AR25-4]
MIDNRVYTVAGAKGGVGKTTTSINLGAALAQTGYSTVTVELDLAMANLVDFLEIDIDVSEATTLHDVLAGEADAKAAIYETDTDLSVVPSGTDLAGYAGTDLDRLSEVVETLRWHHDVVLLDTPAGLSEETMRPIQVADDVVLVSTPRVASIRNVRNTLELADRVDTDVRGLVLTKSGTGASPGADRIADFLDVELLGHVPEDDAVPHSQDKGFPVISNAPKSGAAIAYRKIAGQLVEGPPSPDSTASSVDAAGTDSARDAGQTDDATAGRTVAPEAYGRETTVGPAEAGPDEEPRRQHTPADETSTDEGTRPRASVTEEPGREGATTDSGVADDDHAGGPAPVGGTSTDEVTKTATAESDEAGRSARAQTGDAPERESVMNDDDEESTANERSLGAQIRSLFGF